MNYARSQRKLLKSKPIYNFYNLFILDCGAVACLLYKFGTYKVLAFARGSTRLVPLL